MKNRSLILIIILLVSTNIRVFSRYTFFTPKGSYAIEVSLENTELKRLPLYRNGITSLSVVNNLVIAGTTANQGMSPFLFSASLYDRKVVDILDLNDIIGGQNAIRSGFVRNTKNQLYAGTMPKGSVASGGHLLRIEIDRNSEIQVVDLGIPVSNEGIFAITSDEKCSHIYGITHPSGYFFSYDVKSEVTKVYTDLAPSESVKHSLDERFSLKPKDYLSNSLVMDNNGLVYGSLPFGKLFCFDPFNRTLNEMEVELPFVWGRRTIGQVQCWLKTKDGEIYGANRADGQLFKFNSQTKTINNLGKPIMMPQVAGLVEAADGKIYGIAGGKPGYSHLFSFDEDEGFFDYGNPNFTMVAPGIEQGILWRGFKLSTIATSEDGKYIVMGENESLSQLMVFQVK